MDGIYDITYYGETIGKVTVKKDGLYCLFECICDLPDNGVYRVKIQTEKQFILLGVYIPSGKKAGLKKKLPAKQLSDGITYRFFIDDTKTDPMESMPLPDLCRLEDLRFQNGALFYSNR